MTARRFTKLQQAVTLIPLTLVSVAWTADLAGYQGLSSASADGQQERVEGQLPDGSIVSPKAIKKPASYTKPGSLGLGVERGEGKQIVRTASTNSIPDAALGAYQRSETVINAADKGCQIPWQLVAAVGRVESDHGRTGGNTLGKDGRSRPGIYGVPLTGKGNTRLISDTDGGELDNDTKFDRAVGPMQFIPATWRAVGVDADGDGERLPQDIDDAALGSAVYLCSGSDDLSKEKGQRAAVYRYNRSQEYVDLVLRIMAAYMSGDYTSVPNDTTSAVTFTPNDTYTPPSNQPAPGSGDLSATAPEPATSSPSKSAPKAPAGGDDGGDGRGDGSGDDGGGGNDGGGSTPTSPKPTPKPSGPVEEVLKPVEKVLTFADANTRCLVVKLQQVLNPTAYRDCMRKYGY